MFKLQTLNSIASVGLNLLPNKLYSISDDVKNPDAILVRSQEMHNMSFPGSLKVIGRAGVGVNNIPVAQLTKLGIPVLNTVGANANAVRELVIAGMLMASRNLCPAWEYVRNLSEKNPELEKSIEQNKKQFIGFELMGKTLGVVGLGSIGVKVANLAMHFGMHVIGYDPTITVNRAWELSSGVEQARTLQQLLNHSDFITFHIPLTDSTKNMIDTAQLSEMKSSVVVLNFARDGIVNNEALIEAINQNKIAYYVSDFPHPTLKNHPKVISLPHLGASTKEAEDNCAIMIVKQVRDFLENGNIVNSVNFPTIEMAPYRDGSRLAIVNDNVPNIVAQISTILGAAKLNILGLTNGSRDEVAYTLIDVNSTVSDSILKQVANIKGVTRVRLLSSNA